MARRRQRGSGKTQGGSVIGRPVDVFGSAASLWVNRTRHTILSTPGHPHRDILECVEGWLVDPDRDMGDRKVIGWANSWGLATTLGSLTPVGQLVAKQLADSTGSTVG